MENVLVDPSRAIVSRTSIISRIAAVCRPTQSSRQPKSNDRKIVNQALQDRVTT